MALFKQFLLLCTFCLAFTGCDILLKKEPDTNTVKTDTLPIKRKYDEQGRLKTESPMYQGKRHGLAKNYYPNGSVHSEINYTYDIKNGPSTWYYETGQPYRVTPFVNGLKQGTQIKYYKSGKILAQMPYENDQLVMGTKEYNEYGHLVTKYPEVVVSKIDRVANSGKIILVIEKPKLKLIEECYAEFSSNGIQQKAKGIASEGKMVISVESRLLKNVKTVNVIVNLKTDLGNNILLKKEISL